LVLTDQLQLDRLLTELLEHAQELLATRQRVAWLLDAVVSINSGLNLRATLERIVEAAAQLAQARYAALGVLDDERDSLAEFITFGLDDAAVQRIGPLPMGLGILGLLISDPKPLRLRDLSTHPASAGFPPNHPPMHSFLGVPIVVRGQPFGNLYLTEKSATDEFSDDDERVVTALAAAAGVAIEKAQLFDQAQRRHTWLAAGAALTNKLLSGVDDPLRLIAETARRASAADVVLICQADEGREPMRVAAAAGPDTDNLVNRVVQCDAACTQLVRRPAPRLFRDAGAELPQLSAFLRPTPRRVLAVPLQAHDTTLGMLLLADSSLRAATDADVQLTASFASQAALALELFRAQQEQNRLAVFADRDRIARDLHDQVIQRLFAAGLALQGVEGTLPTPAAGKVHRIVDQLDATIVEIRRSIFSLHAAEEKEIPQLRAQLVTVVTEAKEALGFEPELRLEGPLDTVPQKVADDAVAVLREALSNAARHARAERLSARVWAGDDFGVDVVDDGRGLPGELSHRSGLANLAERAERHGGHLEVGPAGDGPGTRLCWRVPL
jgi:signal transduction histidine kinase